MAADAVDYYELLGIPANASESEIRRAYRKTSLLYHPDKVKPTPETLDKFQLLQTALNILSNPDEKQTYDQSREAKLRRKAENDLLETRRRRLKEDLEAGERGAANGVGGATNGTKRSWSQRELDIKRIAEENRQKREAATRRKMQEANERMTAQEKPTDSIDRSVKVKWIKEGEGLEIDREALEQSFPAGDIESVLILKDKKRRLDGREKKVVMGTGVIVFTSNAAAEKAIARGACEGIESVTWAAEKDKEVEPSRSWV